MRAKDDRYDGAYRSRKLWQCISHPIGQRFQIAWQQVPAIDARQLDGRLPDQVVGLIAITAQLQATDAWARLINMPVTLRVCQADQQKAKAGGAPR